MKEFALGLAVTVCLVVLVHSVAEKVEQHMNHVDPIRPADVALEKGRRLPDKVVQAFNELIAENWDGSSSVFKQEAVEDRIMTLMKMEASERPTIRKLRWLDVEAVYDRAGWYVKLETDDLHSAMYMFTKKEDPEPT